MHIVFCAVGNTVKPNREENKFLQMTPTKSQLRRCHNSDSLACGMRQCSAEIDLAEIIEKRHELILLF